MNATGEAEQYIAKNKPPKGLEHVSSQVRAFLRHNVQKGRNIVFITSGGTTVPLEKNTVRFIDNFSAGTRASASAEYFLKHDYAVIFLHREFSLLPYSRFYSHSRNCFLDYMKFDDTGRIIADSDHTGGMESHLRDYVQCKREQMFLPIPFITVNDYLFYLRSLALELKDCGPKVLFYLAAAVSDFYVPPEKISEHKIQSEGGESTLELKLQPVPKFLKPLVQEWAPDAKIISFKLETQEELLESKCLRALERYGHDLVIGNLLHKRKHQVLFITTKTSETIELTDHEISNGLEIESLMVQKIVGMHKTNRL